jgi:ATP-binding cassette subfamily C protein
LIIVSLILSIRSGENSFILQLSIYAAAAARIGPLGSNILNSFSIYWKSKVAINDFLDFDSKNIIIKSKDVIKYKNFQVLEINDLCFKYGERKIFKNLNLKIEKNRIIGIYGKSGSGKSTLINILLNFEKNYSAKIKFNKINQINFTAFSSLASYIPQDIVLMDGTLANNITLSLKDNFDKKKMNKCLSLAMFNEVLKLKGGLDYIVGHHGNNLSGGEKQRVAIARALYFEKEILILDEPTSGLDSYNENEFMQNIKKLSKKLTIIIVSHNIEIKEYCDEIYNLNDKKLVSENYN